MVADWDAQSKGQNWFDGATNIHLTANGYAQYRNFITWYSVLAKNGNLGC